MAEGGLQPACYVLPVTDLLPIATLCELGLRQLRVDAAPPPPAVLERIRDMRLAARATRPNVDADVDEHIDASLTPGRVGNVVPFKGEEVGLAEAAARLGRSRQAVWSRLQRGTLPGRQDDQGRWRLPSDALQEAT